MNRAEIWYLFGLAAVALIVMRIRATRPASLRDPMALSFTLSLFLPAFGALCKQPFLAGGLDSLFGPNAAWLAADIFFIAGVCAGTYWIEMLADPALRERGWGLLGRWRVAALALVAAWMVLAVRLEPAAWAGLERGGIDVAGSPGLLSGRLAYFGYSIWGLVYLGRGFYRCKQHMRDRTVYLRMTLCWAGITLALAAPLLQVLGTLYVFARPEVLPATWPPLWRILSLVQVGVAVFILATFFRPAYHFVIWLDKQILVRRLLGVRRVISRKRPDLMEKSLLLGPAGLIIPQPDLWLATLVNEIEFAKIAMGRQAAAELLAPAGGAMPDFLKEALRAEREQLLRGLANEPATVYQVTGDSYALARWYAAIL